MFTSIKETGHLWWSCFTAFAAFILIIGTAESTASWVMTGLAAMAALGIVLSGAVFNRRTPLKYEEGKIMKKKSGQFWLMGIVLLILTCIATENVAWASNQPGPGAFTNYKNCREEARENAANRVPITFADVECFFPDPPENPVNPETGNSYCWDKLIKTELRRDNWACVGDLVLNIAGSMSKFSSFVNIGGNTIGYDTTELNSGILKIDAESASSITLFDPALENVTVAIGQKMEDGSWLISFDEALLSAPLFFEINSKYVIQVNDNDMISTILGGLSADFINDMAVDQNGYVYITGTTDSANLPNPTNTADGAYNSAFVSKLTPDLNTVVYTTYLGGNKWDGGIGIDVDHQGNVYVTGETSSTNFPHSNPFDTCSSGGARAFVVKLNAQGDAVSGVCLENTKTGFDILVDDKEHPENVYVSGVTLSAGTHDGFVARWNMDTNSVIHTYLGGSGSDCRMHGSCAMARDDAGYIYITGDTTSADFPITHALDDEMIQYDGSHYSGGGGAMWGGNMGGDAFVAKLTPDLSDMVYSTYIGGSGYEESYGIALDADQNVYIVGATDSKDFPLKKSLKPAGDELSNSDPATGRNDDMFLSRLHWDGTALNLDFSTLLGGSQSDIAFDVLTANAGNGQTIYVAGRTVSDDFWMTCCSDDSIGFSPVFKGGNNDAYVTKLSWDHTASILTTEFGSYLGGAGYDGIGSIASDSQGHIYMAGATSSADFPVTISGSGYQGNRDGFVVKSIVPTNSCSDQKDECADATLKGDVNGDGEITPQDAADAFELSFKSSWTGDELCRADYNGDGEITPQDAADIFEASL